jgi:hypothetical protein
MEYLLPGWSHRLTYISGDERRLPLGLLAPSPQQSLLPISATTSRGTKGSETTQEGKRPLAGYLDEDLHAPPNHNAQRTPSSAPHFAPLRRYAGAASMIYYRFCLDQQLGPMIWNCL